MNKNLGVFAVAGVVGLLSHDAHARLSLDAVGLHDPTTSQGWNTNNLGGDEAYDMFVKDPAGNWLNDPTTVGVQFDLTPGTHRFRFHADSFGFGQLAWPSCTLSLTFNASGLNTAPQVSGVTSYTVTPGVHPPFTAWTGQTYTNGLVRLPASGQLSYVDPQSGWSVVLTDFWFAQMSVYPGIDDVGPLSIGANAQADYLGEFELLVVPAPSTAAALGLGALAVGRRRR